MNNKSIWITGASSGIGKALALKFAKEGTIIIFDDYFDRPNYHIVEKYLKVHQKCGRQAIFKIFNKKKFNLKIIDTEIKNFRHVLN